MVPRLCHDQSIPTSFPTVTDPLSHHSTLSRIRVVQHREIKPTKNTKYQFLLISHHVISDCKTPRYSRKLIALHPVSQPTRVPLNTVRGSARNGGIHKKFEIPRNIPHIPQNIAACTAKSNTGVMSLRYQPVCKLLHAPNMK
jgi:hypothetical protein